MQDYFSISIQGKWVECKKALPRINYNGGLGHIMRGAKRVYFEKDQEEVISPLNEQFMEPMPLRQASMNRLNHPMRPEIVQKPQMLPRVSQQNFAPTRVNIDLEESFNFEDKENFNQRNRLMVHNKENMYGPMEIYADDIKPKPKDPRKGTILELKNKSSKFI